PLLPETHLPELAVLSIHHGPRPLQGGVRRDPGLDRGRHRDRGARHALLLHRVQEDPAPLLHRRLRAVGVRTPLSRSVDLWRSALQLIPGGVNSPVRAMNAIGRDPVFVERGEGAELIDVDGNRYVDWVMSWGPLIAGHAHSDVIAAVTEAAQRGTSYGAPTPGEVELAEEVVRRVPSAEM